MKYFYKFKICHGFSRDTAVVIECTVCTDKISDFDAVEAEIHNRLSDLPVFEDK